LKRAGVSERWAESSWKDFVGAVRMSPPQLLLERARRLRRGEFPDWVLIHGRPSRIRDFASAMVIRTACQGGLTAGTAALPDLIDVEFNRGDADSPDLSRVNVLVVRLGTEPPHRWNGYVLEKLMRRRWADGSFTCAVFEVDPLRINDLYRSSSLTDSFKQKFDWVSVSEKDGR
jgi:hypothetical protein